MEEKKSRQHKGEQQGEERIRWMDWLSIGDLRSTFFSLLSSTVYFALFDCLYLYWGGHIYIYVQQELASPPTTASSRVVCAMRKSNEKNKKCSIVEFEVLQLHKKNSPRVCRLRVCSTISTLLVVFFSSSPSLCCCASLSPSLTLYLGSEWAAIGLLVKLAHTT